MPSGFLDLELHHKTLSLSGFEGGSLSYFLSFYHQKFNKNLCIVTTNNKESYQIAEDLRFFSKSSLQIDVFDSWEVYPYYKLSPKNEVLHKEIEILYRLLYDKTPKITIIPIESLARRLPTKEFFKRSILKLSLQDSIDPKEFGKKLIHLGYQRVSLVEDSGTFAIRGGIIDVFSPQDEYPSRIDLFGDQIESLRTFNSQTQKKIKNIDELTILPAHHILFEEIQKSWKSKLKTLSDAKEKSKSLRDDIQDKVEEKIYFGGIETYLTLFYEELGNLFDYIDKESTFVYTDKAKTFDHHKKEFQKLKKIQKESESLETLFDPGDLFLSLKEISEKSSSFNKIIFNDFDPEAQKVKIFPNSSLIQKPKLVGNELELRPLTNSLKKYLKEDYHIFIGSDSLSQAHRIHDILSSFHIPLQLIQNQKEKEEEFEFFYNQKRRPSHISILPQTLSEGFHIEKEIWISEKEIFGKKYKKPRSRQKNLEAFSSFSELEEKDYIVHELHGLGRYLGLIKLQIQNFANDFLLLEYLGGDKLYVPVDQFDRIYRYASKDKETVSLDKLGGKTWKKTKEKVKKKTRKLAKELLEIQAERKTRKGHAYSGSKELFEEFEASFPHEETADQIQAISEIIKDMEEPQSMDRLLCGDVGYGKTEVAMRAAFKAVLDKKQVAFLCPTTILAIQHLESFKERFKDHAVEVAALSRFLKKKDEKEIIERIKSGQVDIIIGTHRLLSKDIKFNDLGLLIIDEEQRFGVDQKEKIKKFKKLIDVLTMTATPIPRTLNSSLMGLRDLSVINTAPVDRLSIQTHVSAFDEMIVKDAILREVNRGGQVFFVHNRVQTIQTIKERLQKILPQIKIRVGHGQMKEEELEKVILDFIHGKFDLLLSTTIIESGIDIPNANTMIINRADRFGLAQLYQLRGRVGRSHHRAYCYLLTPDADMMTKDARKRLAVIQKFTDLGSGFKIASHDMEIRGAGNILGDEQSGHIHAVGYELYAKLLDEAIAILQGQFEEEDIEPEIKISLPASIPENYVSDTKLRLGLYKQIASAKSIEECQSIQDEWLDRFGELPSSVINLIQLIKLKVLCKSLKILSLSRSGHGFLFKIHKKNPIPTDYFLDKIKKNSKNKILADGSFYFEENFDESKILIFVEEVLQEMKYYT